MIDALKQAVERAAQQPEPEQAALAHLLMQAMDTDAKWDALLRTPSSLAMLEGWAEDAHQEHLRGATRDGETRDLDGLLQWQAREAFRLFNTNPAHPGLKFARIHGTQAPIYSLRFSEQCRVLGRKEDDTMVWFWIGTHNGYEELI